MKSPKKFLSINFGCRVNAAETNQWSQTFIDQGYSPTNSNPDIIFINTCAITKKGEKESLNKIKILRQKYPTSKIFVSGCANLDKIKDLDNVSVFKNDQKEKILKELQSSYTRHIKDKFSHTNRFLLKIQSGCSQFCSYCIVPFKRPKLFSLSIEKAVNTVKKAVENNYQEIIITGVNLDQYQYGFSKLIKNLLEKTDIKLISFGSIPINCIDQNFINLFKNKDYQNRLSHFLHIPIQSGSDKILKLMNRPYDSKKIIETFNKLKSLPSSREVPPSKTRRGVGFGTDIIVGFPTESEKDFQDTLKLCQKIGFTKIHVFKYSPRPNTKARIIFENSPKISKETLKDRSNKIKLSELKN
ncbi:MAG: MiaB/RimO family radical SAM methylthiotransferase [Oligoflexia bacterium]|nr:MiaB/RimO family radical SAM methylthiotransferase [Oligoflexia bacterium]